MFKENYSVLIREPSSAEKYKTFSIRVPEELSKTADILAKMVKRSRNEIICACIRYCFNRMEVREGLFSEIRILEELKAAALEPQEAEAEPERQENQVDS